MTALPITLLDVRSEEEVAESSVAKIQSECSVPVPIPKLELLVVSYDVGEVLVVDGRMLYTQL